MRENKRKGNKEEHIVGSSLNEKGIQKNDR